MIKGIDVASYQPTNYSTAGLDFVFIKVTEGTNYVNPHLAGQVKTARDHKAIVGFYHFQHHGDTAAQVAYFDAKVKPYLVGGDIIALDWEQHGLTTADKDAWLKGVKAVHPTHKVILYTYTSMWATAGKFVQDGLWIADPNNPAGHPNIKEPWIFHQYSEAGGMDHDVAKFNSYAELKEWSLEDKPGASSAPAPKPKPAPVYAPFPGVGFFRLGKKHPLVLAMGKRLVAEGYKGYKVGPSEEFERADVKAYAWWQRKLGYKGTAADGYPGKASWDKLRVPKA